MTGAVTLWIALLTAVVLTGCGPLHSPDGQPPQGPPPGSMGDGPPGGSMDPHTPGDPGIDPGDPRDPEPTVGNEPDAARKPSTSTSRSAEPRGELAGIVAAHNQVRADHCAPPLEWSDKIAKVAQSWAQDLVDRGCAFEHSPGMKYGENLAYMSPAGIGSPQSVTEGWYREVDIYDYKNPGFSFEAGHFTQIVWVSTTHLGCARAECKNAEIWVCNYSPPGNFRGQFAQNVLPTSCK